MVAKEGWRTVATTYVGTFPRAGWRGRWDALLYALGIHKELRLMRRPLIVSVLVKEPEIDLEVKEIQLGGKK